ncbi:MAG: M23 family metallopeptidase [Rhodospirillales bacterium]|nr:M23 family metallopeptidase [Rhodospirillales bacterium]MBO6788573.1 M23 family metallopeptidase [Rhodospirillales bacterium]
MRKTAAALFVAGFSVFSAVAAAETPVFSLPADCALGETCWLVNFVDHDPGPGATDHRCGHLTYDTHKGTDIAIRNDAAMRAGVDVLAAAPGTVTGLRDGMPDSTRADLESGRPIRGRECGNGVVIEHGGGWSTQYCHMGAGSLRVRVGDRVGRGDVLGRIGKSGRSEFPHVHMAVRNGERVVDPFTGRGALAMCNPDPALDGLWDPVLKAKLAYPGPQPFHLGFATGKPNKADIEAGRLDDRAFGPEIGALVFWAEAFSLDRGDKVHLTLRAPGGGLVAENRITVDRPLAKAFWFVGRKRRGDAWATGDYTGTIEITRADATVTRSAAATVE